MRFPYPLGRLDNNLYPIAHEVVYLLSLIAVLPSQQPPFDQTDHGIAQQSGCCKNYNSDKDYRRIGKLAGVRHHIADS
ncbi:hypothetical protein D3C73_1445910 [compost metagenome]